MSVQVEPYSAHSRAPAASKPRRLRFGEAGSREQGGRLRQSYLHAAKHAALMAGRCAQAKHFNRHRKQLQLLRSRLGRSIREIGRKIAGQTALDDVFV